MLADSPLSLDPRELVFRNVHLGVEYTQQLQIRNEGPPVDLELKPGAAERYSIAPRVLRVEQGAIATVNVTLKVLKFAQRQKAIDHGQRDSFHVKVSDAVAAKHAHAGKRCMQHDATALALHTLERAGQVL